MSRIRRHLAHHAAKHARHAAHHKGHPESAATRAKISAAEKGRHRKKK